MKWWGFYYEIKVIVVDNRNWKMEKCLFIITGIIETFWKWIKFFVKIISFGSIELEK